MRINPKISDQVLKRLRSLRHQSYCLKHRSSRQTRSLASTLEIGLHAGAGIHYQYSRIESVVALPPVYLVLVVSEVPCRKAA